MEVIENITLNCGLFTFTILKNIITFFKKEWIFSNNVIKNMEHHWRYYYEKFMYIYCILAPIGILLQSIKIYQTQDAGGVSLATYILALFGCIVWIVYASKVLKDRNNAIIINSSISLIIVVTIIIGVLIYPTKEVDIPVTATVTVTVVE